MESIMKVSVLSMCGRILHGIANTLLYLQIKHINFSDVVHFLQDSLPGLEWKQNIYLEHFSYPAG